MCRIKICGLSRPQDIEAVNAALPDYIGFVFASSRRQVSLQTARELKRNLDDSVKAVGVFVRERIEYIAELCELGIIDIVQLHGDEDEDYVECLKSQISNPVIRAVRVKDAEDVRKAESAACDYLLFDTYQEKQFGGSGKVFDWSVLSAINKPYFLAGGIHSGNILKAAEQCRPYCIDVSSGAETDGLKDAGKIMEIVSKIRSVN